MMIVRVPSSTHDDDHDEDALYTDNDDDSGVKDGTPSTEVPQSRYYQVTQPKQMNFGKSSKWPLKVGSWEPRKKNKNDRNFRETMKNNRK